MWSLLNCYRLDSFVLHSSCCELMTILFFSIAELTIHLSNVPEFSVENHMPQSRSYLFFNVAQLTLLFSNVAALTLFQNFTHCLHEWGFSYRSNHRNTIESRRVFSKNVVVAHKAVKQTANRPRKS